MAKKTPRPVRTLLIFGLAIVVLYGLAALGSDLEAPSRPGPRGRHPDHPVGDRQWRRRHPDQAQAGGRHRRRASQRQRRLRGRGVHAGQPQHHRRDPGREPLRPRRLGQAHRAAAVPARGRPAAAGHPRGAAQGVRPAEPVGRARPARPAPRRRPSGPRSARPRRSHAPRRSPTPPLRLRRRARARPPRLPPSHPAAAPGHPEGRSRRQAAAVGRRTRAWSGCRSSRSSPARPRARTSPPSRRQPRRAADRLQRRGPEVPALQVR